MTRDDVIRMARESGMLIPSFRIGGGLALGTCAVPDFERFAKLVAAAEREACATLCEQLIKPSSPVPGHPLDAWLIGTVDCAEAIRTRGDLV